MTLWTSSPWNYFPDFTVIGRFYFYSLLSMSCFCFFSSSSMIVRIVPYHSYFLSLCSSLFFFPWEVSCLLMRSTINSSKMISKYSKLLWCSTIKMFSEECVITVSNSNCWSKTQKFSQTWFSLKQLYFLFSELSFSTFSYFHSCNPLWHLFSNVLTYFIQ